MKKQDLMEIIEIARQSEKGIEIDVTLPGTKYVETISNPFENLEHKKAYFDIAYDEDLINKNSNEIRIVKARLKTDKTEEVMHEGIAIERLRPDYSLLIADNFILEKIVNSLLVEKMNGKVNQHRIPKETRDYIRKCLGDDVFFINKDKDDIIIWNGYQ